MPPGGGGGGGGGLNAFYWYQIFAIDSAVVEVQEKFSSHGGHLTNAMYHHGKHSNQVLYNFSWMFPIVPLFKIAWFCSTKQEDCQSSR